MFNCSNCGHSIDTTRVELPPFCPRCGEPTQEGASPFDDEDDPPASSPLPPPPPMGAPLPPPPPMGSPLPPPPSRSRRGSPSKTLFGMPGVNFEEDGEPEFPAETASADDLPFPTDDDDDDDDLPFPTDDEDDVPLATPSTPAPLAKPPSPAKKPAVSPPPRGKPARSAGMPPPVAKAAVKPPPIGPSRGKAAVKPPPLGARAGGVKPPPLPAGKKGSPSPPPLPSSGAPPAPPPPSHDAFDSGVLAGDSGVMSQSGTFDQDPFYTGDPEQMPELGSITHGDASTFQQENPAAASGIREFEFQDDGETLELGDLSLPTNEAPAGTARDVELSAPGGPARGDGFDLPAPASQAHDADLPMPADDVISLDDLPAPASGSGSGFGDLPMPADDLPMPADDLPMPADDLPMPADDLPVPAGLDDFPAPADDFGPNIGLDLDDLPADGSGLPTPADILPTAAETLPTPADILPTSADILPTPHKGVEGEHLPESGDTPSEAKQDEASGGVLGRVKPVASGASPSPRPTSNRGRVIVYGVLGLVVLAVGGGVLAMEMGLLEPAPPPPTAQNSDPGTDPSPPPGEVAERPAGILAKFDQDTPTGYVQALELSDQDPLGQAEAALLLHLRYGPDEVRLGLARTLLEGFPVDETKPFVARVHALAKLAAKAPPKEILPLLTADEPRSQLYRAWVLQRQGDHEAARGAAEAAVKARPEDQAAKLAVLEARLAANPVDGLAAMRKAAGESPQHIALQEALMEAALEQGRLGEANEVGRAIQPGAVSNTHKAELLRQRAEIALGQGRTGEATRLLEQAVQTDEQLLPARLARAELWIATDKFAELRTEKDLLVRDHPKDPRVRKLAARIDLQAGDDEAARGHLADLGEVAIQDPEAHHILGEVEALLMKVDEARAAWAKARELDPLHVESVAAELALLLKLELTDEAATFLDERLAALEQAGARDSRAGRRALARVHRLRGELLVEQGQLELALTAAEDAIASDPADNHARLLRAQLLGQLGRRKAYEDALAELHERTGGFPGLTEPLGAMLLRKGKLDELEELIGASLDTPGTTFEVLLTGAALRLAQERPDDAAALAERVLERDPTDSRAHLMLGRALLAKGEYTAALDEMESAQTREGDPEAELWLGQALEYNGRANQARAHYKAALELDPDNLEAAALLGRLYAYEGGARKAIELIQPVVDQTDAYPYAYLALGLAHKDLGKLDVAVSHFQKAQQLDPTLFEAYYQEGRLHNDRNEHAAAIRALQAGLDKAKQNAGERQLVDAWRRLGESCYHLGRRADAKKALQQYMELAPPGAAGRREVERLLGELN